MQGDTAGLIELVLVFGAVVAWAGWELRSLSRLRQQRKADPAPGPSGPPLQPPVPPPAD